MKHDKFVNIVKERANLDTDAHAEQVIEATLSTLAERLHAGEAEHLAAQLPQEIGQYLTEQETKKTFDLSEFYEKVSNREPAGWPQVRRNARAVMSAVQQTVTPGELRDVLAQLPEEYNDLFTFGGDGEYRQL